jgi:hypothetical protein
MRMTRGERRALALHAAAVPVGITVGLALARLLRRRA